MHFPRSFFPLTGWLAAAALLGFACSSSTPDGGLASAGGTGATGGGTKSTGAKGGSSGSANGTGTGGTNAATGGSANATTGGSANAATGGTSAASGGSSNATSSGGTGAYPTDACEGLPFDAGGQAGQGDEACTGVSSEAESVPIDLFIMMDRSVSMANKVANSDMTRWDALQAAMQAFADSSSGDDIRAGIGFFGVTGGNDDTIDCNQGNYSTPKVEIGPLADTGPLLVDAMAHVTPGGLTPGGPALAGALAHAATWATSNPGRATAVVLVTDGYPTQCQPQTASGLAMLAEQAHLSAPYVRTYVLGIGGDFNLDAIAESGGTHAAFKVDDGDIVNSFVSALHNVANTKLACEYALPPAPSGSKKLDFTKVQVTYTTASGDSNEEIPSIPSIQGCASSSNGGWYYDDPSQPTSIMVCPCTCSRFDAGRVDVRVGCKPKVGVR